MPIFDSVYAYIRFRSCRTSSPIVPMLSIPPYRELGNAERGATIRDQLDGLRLITHVIALLCKERNRTGRTTHYRPIIQAFGFRLDGNRRILDIPRIICNLIRLLYNEILLNLTRFKRTGRQGIIPRRI